MKALLVVLCCLVALCVPGCTSAQVEEWRIAAADARATAAEIEAKVLALQVEVERIGAEVAAMPEGPLRDALLAEHAASAEKVALAVKLAGQLRQGATDLDARIAAAEDEIGIVEGIINTVAPVLPPQWGALLTLLAGAALPLWRLIKKNAALAEEKAKTASAIAAFNSTAAGIEAALVRLNPDAVDTLKTELLSFQTANGSHADVQALRGKTA